MFSKLGADGKLASAAESLAPLARISGGCLHPKADPCAPSLPRLSTALEEPLHRGGVPAQDAGAAMGAELGAWRLPPLAQKLMGLVS